MVRIFLSERTRSRIIQSPTRLNFRDPDSATHQLAGARLRLSSPLLRKNSKGRKHASGLTVLSAQERTRTSMPLRALPPQGSTSTNFATCASQLLFLIFLRSTSVRGNRIRTRIDVRILRLGDEA